MQKESITKMKVQVEVRRHDNKILYWPLLSQK
jgi:hypothetical protein